MILLRFGIMATSTDKKRKCHVTHPFYSVSDASALQLGGHEWLSLER